MPEALALENVQLVLFGPQGIADQETLSSQATTSPPSFDNIEGSFNSAAYATIVGLSKLIDAHVPGYQAATQLTSMQLAVVATKVLFPPLAKAASKVVLPETPSTN